MGKGSARRPCFISKDHFDANFERVFGKKKLNVMSREDKIKLYGEAYVREFENDRDRETGGNVPADGHEGLGLHGKGVPVAAAGDEIPERVLFWKGPGYRGEYTCPHGCGHGNHIHCCDGCCERDDYPLKGKPKR